MTEVLVVQLAVSQAGWAAAEVAEKSYAPYPRPKTVTDDPPD